MNPDPDMAARQHQGGAQNIHTLFTSMVREFRVAEVPTPELDARLIISHGAGLTHEEFAMHPEKSLAKDAVAKIMHAAKRRCAREPVSRIVGEREFWGLDFKLGAQTLDPRPDTETLVQAAIEVAADHTGDKPLSILDVGTGSGCILIALLHELRDAQGTGTDANMETLRIAQANARRHKLGGRANFVCTSWLDGLSGGIDIIVSNPPYIPSEGITMLEPEVARYDPHDALDGGCDGLDAYRWMIPRLSLILKPGGWVLFEIGAGQAPDICAMFQAEGNGDTYAGLRQQPDLAGHIRCVAAQRLSCR